MQIDEINDLKNQKSCFYCWHRNHSNCRFPSDSSGNHLPSYHKMMAFEPWTCHEFDPGIVNILRIADKIRTYFADSRHGNTSRSRASSDHHRHHFGHRHSSPVLTLNHSIPIDQFIRPRWWRWLLNCCQSWYSCCWQHGHQVKWSEWVREWLRQWVVKYRWIDNLANRR